jgi:hypothetical protein
MVRGKYQRKRDHAQQQAALVEPIAPENIVAEATKPKMKQSRWQRTKTWVKEGSTFTNCVIAAFTFVLSLAAIYQFVIMDSQLKTMRKDQRPWIKATAEIDDFVPLADIHGKLHLVTNGKTPALRVRGDLVIEKVANGDQPKFDYPDPHPAFVQGAIFPGDPVDVKIPFPSSKLTADEIADYHNLKIFFVVYGVVHYSDYFGVNHWTKFCAYIFPSDASGELTAMTCANYGDVDGN